MSQPKTARATAAAAEGGRKKEERRKRRLPCRLTLGRPLRAHPERRVFPRGTVSSENRMMESHWSAGLKPGAARAQRQCCRLQDVRCVLC